MYSDTSAVAPGTNLREHARLLNQVHNAVMSGSKLPAEPRSVVLRSWQRTLGLGLSADPRPPKAPARIDEVLRRRELSPLRSVIDVLRANLLAVSDTADYLIATSDAEGVVLWREGKREVARHADRIGFVEGALWTEAAVGTNAIGTALSENAPVQLFAAEHFVRNQHPWTCTASPIYDPRDGELLGVIDISGPARTVHPAVLALVQTAARLAEASLWRHHDSQIASLRASAEPHLLRAGNPAMIVDDNGWIAAATGVVVGSRVPAPVGDTVMNVVGLGSCVPERIHGGWLLRPLKDGRRVLRLRLELECLPPQALLEGADVWRYPLTRRQAQVLALLMAAGPRGLDGRALSVAIYGDGSHQVAVRAEVSRLRRTLGGLIAARPYRISSSVLVVPNDPVGLQPSRLWQEGDEACAPRPDSAGLMPSA